VFKTLLVLLALQNASIMVVHVEGICEGSNKVEPIVGNLLPHFSPQYVLTERNAPVGLHNIREQGFVVVVGGYLRACYSNALQKLLENSAGDSLGLIIPMRAVYHGTNRTLYEYYVDNLKRDNTLLTSYIKEVIEEAGFTNSEILVLGEIVIIWER